ncbi:ABC transporter, permease protein [Leifsonia xyli subsp. xyli str. CTCB07]|uniref:ABC transporter, permease protein n=1 Tax=Leifsonia xyli subsp. xyli (strain CTCB07) TaxID=281090 RepID=Q6AG38_LEIXX|nr:ABC transporter, permease protein [Leifsonia xyli subsp. xyli str. CTCB07]
MSAETPARSLWRPGGSAPRHPPRRWQSAHGRRRPFPDLRGDPRRVPGLQRRRRAARDDAAGLLRAVRPDRPRLTRRASLEAVLLIALGLMLAGHLVRAASGSFVQLAIGSAVAFAGMGVGNVLLPPLVKRYFPDRIGLVTALYATVMSVSTLRPPLVAVPVADASSWHVSLGMWALVSVLAIVLWLRIMLTRTPAHPDHDVEVEQADHSAVARVWRSGLGWAMAIVFATSSLNAYAMFGWLPQILHDVAGTPPAEAGTLLSVYTAMGVPAGLLVPLLAARMRNVALLVYAGVAFFVIGYLGLIFAPTTATVLWVAIAGLGPLLFPLSLVLINTRTRTHAGSVALSGFAQGIGYVIGSFGPLAVGLLHEVTGAWTLALALLTATALAAAAAGAVVARPVPLEDR